MRARTKNPERRKALASFALAIFGAVFGLLILPLCCSLAAIPLGISARRSSAGRRGRAIATAGVVLGVLGVVFWTLAWWAFLSSPDQHIGGAGGFL
jgi:hypothetical protein